jgi:hypothetical protein
MKVKKSITTLFMVRPLGINIESINKYGFINAYIKDSNQDHQYDDCVYLLFKPSDMDTFSNFLENEREKNQIVEDYDYEGGYVVVVYKYNSIYKKDLDLIKKGLYSKTSKNFQDLFPRIIKIVKDGKHKDEISLQFRIFNRTQELINFWENKLGVVFTNDQEVWEGFHEENETLDFNKIKNYVEQISN